MFSGHCCVPRVPRQRFLCDCSTHHPPRCSSAMRTALQNRHSKQNNSFAAGRHGSSTSAHSAGQHDKASAARSATRTSARNEADTGCSKQAGRQPHVSACTSTVVHGWRQTTSSSVGVPGAIAGRQHTTVQRRYSTNMVVVEKSRCNQSINQSIRRV